MTDIPRARYLILQAVALLQEAESLMTRPTPTRRAKRTSDPINPVLAQKIRVYARRNPKASYKEIGAVWRVDAGRVSEAIRGLR
jgi:hypothetical protein